MWTRSAGTVVTVLLFSGSIHATWAQTASLASFPNPPNVDVSGGNGSNGQDRTGGGTNGGPGTAGQNYSGELGFAANGSGASATVSVMANGGKGGLGGNSGNTNTRGGSGGAGAAAGGITIRLTPTGNVTSASALAALYASVIGGSGGNGGNSGNTGDAGESGNGGAAGTISFTTDAGETINSTTTNVPAILFTANGGNGGTSPVTNQTFATSAVGRKGGDGGNAGSVMAVLYGTIRSAGSGVVAIAAGGNGGMGGRAAAQFASATGGAGGNGGKAGIVRLFNLGSISATGAVNPSTGLIVPVGGKNVQLSVVGAGMLAESIGGSGAIGGNGGSFAPDGGAGGLAASGGDAGLYQYGGSLTTSGYSEAGMFAQSVGGAGGSGGNAQGYISPGAGSGGKGGDGGQANAQNEEGGYVGTSGKASDALVAQSIGGGGGYGGDVTLIGGATGIAIGGAGNGGGNGSRANVRNGTASDPRGTISTLGDNSDGLLAQSIGGGGGIGGNASSTVVGAVSMAIGGSAGEGGNGNVAVADNYGTVQTAGNHSDALSVQSIGGGGGKGGWGTAFTGGIQLTATAGVGGTGGSGGLGGDATAQNFGQITTLGANSLGMLVQSVGGGGGDGGDALSQAFQPFNVPRFPSVTITLTAGGNGSKGGIGGPAKATNNGAIITTGTQSGAILTQSVGGGGGDGGDATSLVQSIQPATVTVNDTIGGVGGSGGNGGQAEVANNGALLTLGELSPAIVAQSIGGGGGNGGAADADTGTVTSGNSNSAQVTLALGGSARDAGDGGTVIINNSGGILTRGDAAAGIIAQSVGGGGGTGGIGKALGSGGSINVNIGVGGSGGGGGNGGIVSVTQTGSILTAGGASPAILAQSIGGGGGDGGEAASGGGSNPLTTAADFLKQGLGIGAGTKDQGNGIVALLPDAISGLKELVNLGKALAAYDNGNSGTPNPKAGKTNVKLSVDVGAGIAGKGGAAGNGQTVVVENSGALQTNGPDSPAILAMSVGGGGGDGGASNPAAGGLIGDAETTSVAIGVGGKGGSGGNGGPVIVNNTGSITTLGDLSFGIHAQSIGGGGGDGGVTIAQNAILNSFSLSLGGNGGSASNGGTISVNLLKNSVIRTQGQDSIGVVAQSIGGGGGFAYLMGTATGAGGNGQSGSGFSNGAFVNNTNVNLTFDGSSGTNGAGGAVGVTLNPTTAYGQGHIDTTGPNAYGVLAQSIGGGGGLILGVPNSGTLLSKLYPGSETGNGGPVDVSLTNGFYIFNTGPGGAGVVAQSIGGGGGLIGELSKVDLTQAVVPTPKAQKGQGGNVSVTLSNGGNIVTNGYRAYGIIAQALGGGGGILDQTDGNGYVYAGANSYACGNSCTGNVSVTLFNNTVVRVNGSQSYAIFVQSQGNGTNNTSIDVESGGYVESWGQSTGAIYVAGAGSNQIINRGIIDNGLMTGTPTASGYAIAGNKPASINNYGTISGSIVLPFGSSALVNQVGALINSFGQIELGTGGTLINNGMISPYGGSLIGATTITGTLIDTPSSDLELEVSPVSGPSDHLIVNGSAQLAGTVTVRLAPLTSLAPGYDQTAIVNATGEIYDAQPLILAGSTPVLSFSLAQPDPTTLDVDTAVNFAPDAAFAAAGLLTPNRASVGAALDQIESLSNTTPRLNDGLIDSIAEIPTIGDLATTYDSMSGEAEVDAQSIGFSNLQNYEETVAQQMESTPGASGIRHVQGWVTGLGGSSRLTDNDTYAALDAQSGGAAVGFESWVTPEDLVGISAGGGSTDFQVAGETSQANATSAFVSVYGRKILGRIYVSGVMSYSNDNFNLKRGNIANFAGVNGVTSTNFNENLFGGRLEVGLPLTRGPLEITPFAAIEADGLWQDDFAEQTPPGSSPAAQAIALRYGNAGQVSIPMTLGTKFVHQITLSPQDALQLNATIGWTHQFQTTRSLSASFIASPDVAFPVQGIPAAANVADLQAGVTWLRVGGFSISAAANANVSGRLNAIGGTVQIAKTF